MKIESIKAHPLWVGDRNQLLVKVTTECGVHGWGEAGLSSRELAVAGAVEHFARFLVGRCPLEPARLWQELYRSQYFEGGRSLTAAMSAIDIALHDIAGKALDLPVHRLLGGKQRDVVPTFGCVRSDDVDELVAFARNAMDVGWNCLRLGWKEDAPEVFEPRPAIAWAARAMTAARRALGPQVTLGTDLHHRFSVAEAASFCSKLPQGTLDFVEEPIRDETPSAYASLRRMTDVPFAIGEEFASKWQFAPYVERQLLDHARVDICNVGGFTEAMKVAGWCEAHYVDLMPHNPLGPICTAATVHLAAAVPNLSWVECWETPDEALARQESPVFLDRLRLDDAVYPVPDAPGLGVDVDETRLCQDEPFRHSEMPHLRRADGSHTNW
ncbi:mandelate racemase/muconate lactonizing enzyme family protein [Aurantimonas sp. VKM B-3413]|uniref:mandelate racemase/muconate lactonizing enzyme family protein n=1 Tax=Aurantimonas sp. VKM B-3413 TaxID=2779401 RepID=UPI001E42787A|nr:mandelate racemase/muconate lactonizing enzyme family protein [Aurantimonas sp. VKM B-3413]MCB8840483.1 mandelate racemase/muconate lactonizing enzyme family protein [Aurantimonas sp. VKM B-3413]